MNIETIAIGVAVGLLEFIFKPIQKALGPLIKEYVIDKIRKNQSGVYERKVAIACN